MKSILIFTMMFLSVASLAQVDSSRLRANPGRNFVSIMRDSLNIRERLIQLAIQNSDIAREEANLNIAKYNLKKAKAGWLDAVSLSANINEFVIQSSPAASFFPKYNVGVNLPLGVFAKQSSDIKIAREIVAINEIDRNEKIKKIRTDVLIKYEDYLEKKELLELQMDITQEQYTRWLKAQKDYAAGGKIDDLNEAYKDYNAELSKQRTKERDVRVALIELEQMTGFRLDEILAGTN